jgi:hypothetical protein
VMYHTKDPEVVAAIVKQGVVAALLVELGNYVTHEPITWSVCVALDRITSKSLEARTAMVRGGGVAALFQVLSTLGENASLVRLVCETLTRLVYDCQHALSPEWSRAVVAGVRVLLHLLGVHASNPLGLECICKLLANVTPHFAEPAVVAALGNQRVVSQAKGDALLSVLRTHVEESGMKEAVCKVVTRLMGHNPGR